METENPIDRVEPPNRVELLRNARKEPILDASLVLASQGVKHWIEFDGADFSLSVEYAEASSATQTLRQYDVENAGFQLQEPEVTPLELSLSPLLHLAIPVSVFFWTGAGASLDWLTGRGGADAARILRGEWWRCVTATSLHANQEHLLGNLLSGFFILNLLRRRCGPGTSMLLLTLAAGLTNFLVALASSPNHFSIGFSTVVFAALGMLAGLETRFLPRHPLGGLRNLSPLLAAFFLAVFIGIGEQADVKAHFIGFALGAATSPAASKLQRRWASVPWQIAGVLLVYAMYGLAWALAQR